MLEPRVSIIIPVYNGANFMREAIDSALAQTWANTEVVVVNDGSNDGGATVDIARSYGERIIYIEKPNGGVASALNVGLRAMSGSIFCWLSHDDRHHPDKTRRQVEDWIRHGRREEFLFSDYRLIDSSGAMINEARMDHAMLKAKPLYSLLRGAIHGCTVFIPRMIFDTVGFFDESLPTTQDYELWRRIIGRYDFRHMPEVLIDGRLHPEQGSKKPSHAQEATTLWYNMVVRTPVDQMISYEGSETRFIAETAQFLERYGLNEASARLYEHAARVAEGKLVSVIIPVFNRVAPLLAAIDSVARQTHPNIEVIVVDDGSTEDLSVLKPVLAAFPGRARMIQQDHAGPAAARNRGWREALGDYIAFLDSDGLFLPTKLARQTEFMETTGAAFTHTSYFRDVEGASGLSFVGTGNSCSYPEIIAECAIATSTVMLRRTLWEEGYRFPESIRGAEDVCLWLTIASAYGVQGLYSPLAVIRL